MGLLDDYGINPEEIKESSFDIEDGTYYFEIGEADVMNGTANKPDDVMFYIEYNLFDEEDEPVGSTRSWYTLSQDGDTDTKRVQQSLSFMKGDLKRLGITDLSDFDGSEVVGLKGVLQLVSTPGKGANRGNTYQNIQNIRLAEEEPTPKKTPAKKAAAKPSISKEDAAAKARVKAKQAARAAEAEEVEEDEDENPFG